MVLTADKESLIWKTLNETRGKIEPSEYKNYIFGVMFYKFLSEKAQNWLDGVLRGETWANVWAQNPEKAADFMQRTLGYVIQPGDMFSDWMTAINEDKFNIMMVSDALVHFDQGVSQDAKEDFAGIFADMDLTSTRLGANAQTRTATVMDWINLMDKIELDEDADVLGDLYEYLIGMFAANSGAKAGEFYTPHQVSDIMARILTAGREDLEEYSLYDPTMGSGSLLLTTASYMKNAGVRGAIKYYGQEWITTTYNLARMNLMMHGVEYNDINLRNADTLNNDWPDGVVEGVDNPRMFDAVMANPPYSQKWDNTNREDDPRFQFGVAPKSKADYAFLLHSLYHLKSDGRMAIVLPHGVLFRGAAEGRIRKELLANHNIVAIIGLPEKIFTNTGIPTVIMVLEKNRKTDDVMFIDASKGYEKQKNSNKLRQEDIDKIVTTYLAHEDVDKYAHVATMAEIEENDYNLIIPRYVDTFEEEAPVDTAELLANMKSLSAEEDQLTGELKEMMADLVVTHPEDQKILDDLKEFLIVSELSHNSNRQPAIRFKGFTDPWKQRKLKNTVEVSSGRDYKHLNSGNIPVYGTGGHMLDVDNALSYTDDAVGIGRKGTIDKPYILKAPFWTVDTLFYCIPRKKFDLDFIFAVFQRINWKSKDESTGVPSLSKNTINSVLVMVPSYGEQVKIGFVFEQLDNLIALHQRKVEVLQNLKKALLQRMFASKDNPIPDIRFAGFTDPWEERNLRDLLNKNSEKNKNLSVINVESVSNKTGFTKQTEQFEDYSVASADLSNYYVIREQQFAYNPSRINVGSIAYKDLGEETAVVSPLYVSFSTKKVLNDGFLWNWFKTTLFDAQRQRLSEGGVRDTLSFNQLSEMNIIFPTYPEQEKIGAFFKQLDDTIALHQRKVKVLQDLKKALLQKMFI